MDQTGLSVPVTKCAVQAPQETANLPECATGSCRQIAQFLTEVCGERSLFIPCHRVITEGGVHHDDVIVVVNSSSTSKFRREDQDRSALPSGFNFTDGGELKNLIHYSDISLICVVNTEEESWFRDGTDQLWAHLSNVLRYQPGLTAANGILAYKHIFYIASLRPGANHLSNSYQWQDEFQYSVGMGEKYQLYDLLRHDLAANVAVGVRASALPRPTQDDCFVIQSHRQYSSNEFNAFQNIFGSSNEGPLHKCTAGIVRPDLKLSHTPEKNDTDTTQETVITVLKTIGDTLASCKSVKEFLKVMYDLVEVHRMLVEDHGVLHRDINWENVLINVLHFDGNHCDAFCGRPFIDAVLGIPVQERRVHVAISKFSSARPMSDRNSARTGKVMQRSPFMSSALCWRVGKFQRSFATASFRPVYEAIFGQLNNAQVAFENETRSREVRLFRSDMLELQNLAQEYLAKEFLKDGEGAIKKRIRLTHMPYHDAESIFWLIVFFFIRACPADYVPETDENERERCFHRTALFESMLENAIGKPSERFIPDPSILPPQLGRYYNMLERLQIYFWQPWFSLAEKEHLSHQLFHGHNVLQYFLLREIKALEATGDDILLRKEPLDVYASSLTMSRPEALFAESDGRDSGSQVTVETASVELKSSDDGPPDPECIAERLHAALDSSAQCNLW